VAFALKTGDVSQPIESPFGVHLITVTDRKPGDLSLEDVRGKVLDVLSKELWDKTVAELRTQAKIERIDAERKKPVQ
jgi:peptidyl-prolyl cis-trans isomerase C